ncbi:MAG: hypothetical protein LLG14_06715 [Nocardiaceae bacterium]|nr:hypothetical protein [Nocardiaceae bacterium]
MSDVAAALSAELGGRLPAAFTQLSDDNLEWLLDAVRRIRSNTAESLEKSTEESVNSLPVLMRGPARSILGGEK